MGLGVRRDDVYLSGVAGLASRQNRTLDLAEADAIAITLAPAAHDKRIAIFEKRPDDAAGQLDWFCAVPADLQKTATLLLVGARDGATPQEIADIHGAA